MEKTKRWKNFRLSSWPKKSKDSPVRWRGTWLRYWMGLSGCPSILTDEISITFFLLFSQRLFLNMVLLLTFSLLLGNSFKQSPGTYNAVGLGDRHFWHTASPPYASLPLLVSILTGDRCIISPGLFPVLRHLEVRLIMSQHLGLCNLYAQWLFALPVSF